MIATDPFGLDAVVTVKGSPSTSLSSSKTTIFVGVSSTIVALSSTATGGSFTAVTDTETVALSVPPRPSEMTYVIVVVPLKFVSGKNSNVPSELIDTLPSLLEAVVIVRGSPSGSLSSSKTTIVAVVSSAMVAVSPTAIGASLMTSNVKSPTPTNSGMNP